MEAGVRSLQAEFAGANLAGVEAVARRGAVDVKAPLASLSKYHFIPASARPFGRPRAAKRSNRGRKPAASARAPGPATGRKRLARLVTF